MRYTLLKKYIFQEQNIISWHGFSLMKTISSYEIETFIETRAPMTNGIYLTISRENDFVKFSSARSGFNINCLELSWIISKQFSEGLNMVTDFSCQVFHSCNPNRLNRYPLFKKLRSSGFRNSFRQSIEYCQSASCFSWSL